MLPNFEKDFDWSSGENQPEGEPGYYTHDEIIDEKNHTQNKHCHRLKFIFWVARLAITWLLVTLIVGTTISVTFGYIIGLTSLIVKRLLAW